MVASVRLASASVRCCDMLFCVWPLSEMGDAPLRLFDDASV